MGDHIYFMAKPRSYDAPDHPCFERYDTLSQSWEELEPLPPFDCSEDIIGTAVLDDTILFNIDFKIQAYVVSRNKWYAVNDLNRLCCNIQGEVVVLNNIIYALKGYCESLVTFTLNSQENDDGDLVFTCDLLKEYVVPGLGEMKFKFTLDNSYGCCTRLVHLGKDNFCAVFSCGLYRPANGRQMIQLTYMEVSEKKSIVTNICVHEFKIPAGNFLEISRCFSMPNCKSSALKEGTALFNQEDEAEIVTLPPELASPITIGGRTVVIEDRRTSLTRGDSNRTICSSSSGSNDVNNHGKDSRSESSSGGRHNSGKKSRKRSRSKGPEISCT